MRNLTNHENLSSIVSDDLTGSHVLSVTQEQILHTTPTILSCKPDFRITKYDSDWSFRKYFCVFISIFGVIWLFLEPLVAIISNPLAALGLWRYFILIILPAAITALVYYIDRYHQLGKERFIKLEVILTTSGKHYIVEAPQDMRTEEFVNKLLVRLSHEIDPEVAKLYDHKLLYRNEDSYDDIEDDSTLLDGGVRNGGEAMILSEIKPKYRRILQIRLYKPNTTVSTNDDRKVNDFDLPLILGSEKISMFSI